MKRIFICFSLWFAYGILSGQEPQELVTLFFRGMYEADTHKVKKIFVATPSFFSSSTNKANKMVISNGKLSDFLKTISSHKLGELDEQISNIKSNIDQDVANVTMDYSFYYKGQFSHCGINNFHFLRMDEGWKCTGIDDTRYHSKCENPLVVKANKFLDEWHMDATRADSTAYFSKLHDNSIFIGTDSSEVWDKKQFGKYAGPYFAKGKAWDFKKLSRNIHYDYESNILWFDEMLATRMGPCRGSGYLKVSASGQLSIMQYVLSLTVPNDKINGVIDAIKGK